MRATVAAIFFAMIPLAIPENDKAKDRLDKDYAAELPRIAPTEPKDALKTFKLAPGFKIEIAAAESLIRSPVAVDFDEDGRMYVAEFPEYNLHSLTPSPPPPRGGGGGGGGGQKTGA